MSQGTILVYTFCKLGEWLPVITVIDLKGSWKLIKSNLFVNVWKQVESNPFGRYFGILFGIVWVTKSFWLLFGFRVFMRELDGYKPSLSFTNHHAHFWDTQALRNSLLVSRHWRPEFAFMADVVVLSPRLNWISVMPQANDVSEQCGLYFAFCKAALLFKSERHVCRGLMPAVRTPITALCCQLHTEVSVGA